MASSRIEESKRNEEEAFFLDGRRYPLRNARSLGALILQELAADVALPDDDEPPYLFCGNGSCRDCNLLMEGLPDVTSCRVPVAPGMSVRSGEGAGDENALARKIGRTPEGEAISCDVAVVGAGRSGRSAAAEFQNRGCTVELFDARGPKPRPVGVLDGRLVAFVDRSRRDVEADTIVLATGARDVFESFPGSELAGVVPMDLLERYLTLRSRMGSRFLLVGGGERASTLESTLHDLGAHAVARSERVAAASGKLRVERAVLDENEIAVDTIAVAGKRVPSLEIAKALGCRTSYDRERGYDVLEVDRSGRTSVRGVLAVGGLVAP